MLSLLDGQCFESTNRNQLRGVFATLGARTLNGWEHQYTAPTATGVEAGIPYVQQQVKWVAFGGAMGPLRVPLVACDGVSPRPTVRGLDPADMAAIWSAFWFVLLVAASCRVLLSPLRRR